jgi:hypothetical protein
VLSGIGDAFNGLGSAVSSDGGPVAAAGAAGSTIGGTAGNLLGQTTGNLVGNVVGGSLLGIAKGLATGIGVPDAPPVLVLGGAAFLGWKLLQEL